MKVREALVLTPSETAAWLERQRAAGRSTAILSTCNRFEIYWSGGDDLEPWFREFARERGVELGPMLVRLGGEAAVRRLFCVASGLDSQILGETEILGQVRRANQAARAAGASTREFDAVFQGALEAGRRVRHETALGRQGASVSSAAVSLALATTTRGNCVTALVLGAGEVADGVVRALVEQGVGRVTLVNRHPERAAALAAKWGVEARSWAEIKSLLACADLVFVATGAKHPLLSAEDLTAAAAGRGSDLVVLDLAVPRNVAPAARGLPGIRLVDLEHLRDLHHTGGQSTTAVAEAHRIVDEELERLKTNLRARAAAPQLAELHRLGLVLAQEEAERALAHLGQLSQVERQIVRDGATRLVRRVLYSVSRRLKEDMRNRAPGRP